MIVESLGTVPFFVNPSLSSRAEGLAAARGPLGPKLFLSVEAAAPVQREAQLNFFLYEMKVTGAG